MILVDTSVWVSHLHRGSEPGLQALLEAGQVLAHPFVTGEVALGHLRRRDVILNTLQNLPQAPSVSDAEMLIFIERQALYGIGIGYVDAHLVASARLSNARLWSHDRRLHTAAAGLGLAYSTH